MIIQSYIFIFSFEEDAEADLDDLETFVRQEPERNWREFLFISNSECWKRVRNELRIWSLNEKAFLKYLIDNFFRGYINERMINPVLQLQCRYFDCFRTFNKTDQIINSLLVSEMVARLSTIGCLSISAYSMSEFPSSRFLHTLRIFFAFSLQGLGDYPVLEALHLRNCTGLTTVGQMDKLKGLLLKDSNVSVLSQFPLEQLETLVISGFEECDFLKVFHRLKSLKSLHVALLTYVYESFTFPAQRYPFLTSLVKLRLENFPSINLTGLINLQHLSILGTPSDKIFGKDKVYPHLISFAWKTTSTREDQLDLSRTLLTNVSELTLLTKP
jgi:hypothetical protein